MSWSITMSDRKRPEWAHENRVIKEWPLARLRDYSAPDADPDMIATVILPPQAGHDSSIIDFTADQSQVVVGRESGCHRIYCLDWIGATQETKDAGIDDYMAILRETAELLGGKVNLVGDCQGGWTATIFTALYPERVNTLAIAGAPIDFHAGEPLIRDWVDAIAPGGDMTIYRSVVEANNGVLPGRFLLDGFKALQPDQEFSRSIQLLANLHDAEHVERYRQFEDWFQWTQALPGVFYLWVVEHLFIRNSLIKGELVVEGRIVDLAAIECPLFLMAGQTDHITPADQVWALADYASTPASMIGRQSSTGGHLGLFMGHESLRNHWQVIFKEMAGLSTPTPDDDPEVLTDEPSQPVASKATSARKTPRRKSADVKPAAVSKPAEEAPDAEAAATRISTTRVPAKRTPTEESAASPKPKPPAVGSVGAAESATGIRRQTSPVEEPRSHED
ncbi:alpha/beta fold hydrolase [Brevibacterium daeguense]|nr:alpha/beta fold hydrolase [Brevibacterium daeguense]